MSMAGWTNCRTEFIDVCGTKIELRSTGAGRPILFLHPGHGLIGAGAMLEKLATSGRILAPSHPGFGGSELPASITTADDLAYFYLDLIETLDLRDVALIGASFGGWLAAEIATKASDRIARLVLIDSVGVKFGDRDTRDIADLHAVQDDELWALQLDDPKKNRPDYAALSDDDLVILARNNETLALLAWRPYMYNPKLRGRLRRIRIPTLVLWGAGDRVVPPGYGRALCREIPGARFETVERAGHLSFVEQPQACAARVEAFLGSIKP